MEHNEEYNNQREDKAQSQDQEAEAKHGKEEEDPLIDGDKEVEDPTNGVAHEETIDNVQSRSGSDNGNADAATADYEEEEEEEVEEEEKGEDDDGSSGADDHNTPQDMRHALKDSETAGTFAWPAPLDNDNAATIALLDENGTATAVRWPCLDKVSDREVVVWLETHQRLLVRVVTWNLQGRPPPKEAAMQIQLLPLNKFHVYVVGSEECERGIASSAVNPSKKVWESTLKSALGNNYTAVCGHTLQATHSMVFVHNALLPLISDVNSIAVATGVANTLGNKGAVALSFSIGNTSLLFMNAHLAAHQHKVKARDAQYHRIMDAIARYRQNKASAHEHQGSAAAVVSSEEEERAETTTNRAQTEAVASPLEMFDHAVFAGDLNYRIHGNRTIVDKLIQRGMQEVLLANDQLLRSMAGNLSFQGFAEGPLNFLPTYKLQREGDLYDPGPKRRIPAWTDRILYKPTDCQLLTYRSEANLRSSDHRPVYASFAMKLQMPTQGSAETKQESALNPTDLVTTSEVCSIM